MALTDLDGELLELLALESPWFTVRDEFESRYGSTGALARRLMELQHEELLVIRPKAGGQGVPSVAVLEADAALDAGIHPVDAIGAARWTVVATERGFAAVEDRLNEE